MVQKRQNNIERPRAATINDESVLNDNETSLILNDRFKSVAHPGK